MTTTILKATSQGQLLTGITAMLGCTPTQSLVIAPMQGNRSHGAIRADLPDPRSTASIANVTAHLLGIASQIHGVTGIVAVIFADSDKSLHAPLAENVLALSGALGLNVAGMLYSTPTGWGEYFTDAHHTDPAPLIEGAPVAASDQHTGAQLPPTDPALAEAVGATYYPSDDDASFTAFLEAVLDVDVENPDPSVLAHLADAMVRPDLRDTALMQWASDTQTGAEVLAAQTAWRITQAPIPERFTAIYLGEADRPDPDRLAAALKVCRLTAAHTEGEKRAALLAAAGWLSWAQGRSTHAIHYLDMAADADPALTIVAVLKAMYNEGMTPRWAITQ